MLFLKEIYYPTLLEKTTFEPIKPKSLDEILEYYKLENALVFNEKEMFLDNPTAPTILFGRKFNVNRAPAIIKHTQGKPGYEIYRYDLINFSGQTRIIYDYSNSNIEDRQDPASLRHAADKEKYNLELYNRFIEDGVKSWYNKIYLKQIGIRNKIEQSLQKLPSGPFGKVFDGEERNLPYKNPEKNTPEEVSLRNVINKHILTTPLDQSNAKKIKNILSKELYNDVFTKPETSEVYRGMLVNREVFNTFMLKFFDIEKQKIPKKGTINPRKKINYIPQGTSGIVRGASSWSKELHIARNFSDFGGEVQKSIRLILIAKTNENPNKFFDLKNWYSEMGMHAFQEEAETVGLGTIIVDKIMWEMK
jgi:hypothetical protein